MKAIQLSLKLGDEADSVNNAIVKFLKKMTKTCFKMAVSDPVIVMDLKKIGERVSFNSFRHESMDGFVKAKQECIVLIPSIWKTQVDSGDMLFKDIVLPLDYEFPE